jgi:hypothetical protein
MTKWFVIVAVILLAPKFVTDVFSSSVNFVSTQGRALTSEVVKEATKTINEAK